jgi:hypothetical protein
LSFDLNDIEVLRLSFDLSFVLLDLKILFIVDQKLVIHVGLRTLILNIKVSTVSLLEVNLHFIFVGIQVVCQPLKLNLFFVEKLTNPGTSAHMGSSWALWRHDDGLVWGCGVASNL